MGTGSTEDALLSQPAAFCGQPGESNSHKPLAFSIIFNTKRECCVCLSSWSLKRMAGCQCLLPGNKHHEARNPRAPAGRTQGIPSPPRLPEHSESLISPFRLKSTLLRTRGTWGSRTTQNRGNRSRTHGTSILQAMGAYSQRIQVPGEKDEEFRASVLWQKCQSLF